MTGQHDDQVSRHRGGGLVLLSAAPSQPGSSIRSSSGRSTLVSSCSDAAPRAGPAGGSSSRRPPCSGTAGRSETAPALTSSIDGGALGTAVTASNPLCFFNSRANWPVGSRSSSVMFLRDPFLSDRLCRVRSPVTFVNPSQHSARTILPWKRHVFGTTVVFQTGSDVPVDSSSPLSNTSANR